jgi:hypothetical protein
MRILMTADTVGGVWTYALELARALKPHGVDLAIATMGAPISADQRHAAIRLHNVELFESRFKLEWMDEPWADVARAAEWLLHLEAKIQPERLRARLVAMARAGDRGRALVRTVVVARCQWRRRAGGLDPVPG